MPAAAVVIVAGFQVPVIPLLDEAGKPGAVAPTQSGPTWVNTGVIWTSIEMSTVVATAHWPGSGVNV